MKSLYVLFSVLLVVSYAQALEQADGNVTILPDGSRYLNDKILVQFKESSPPLGDFTFENGIAQTGIESLDEICRLARVTRIEPTYKGIIRKPDLKSLVDRIFIFSLGEDAVLPDAITRLSSEPIIEFAEPIYIPDLFYMPNDPYADTEWHLAHTQTYEAWDIVRGDTTRHSVVGVIDTGVRWTHPDMTDNIWINYVEDLNHNNIPDDEDFNNIDDDGNGFIDDVWGWDFGNEDNNPTESSLEHGTAVAGSVSEATDNGIMGAAIGFSARVMALKTFTDNGDFYGYVNCFIYATDNGAHIINCSWGTPVYSDIFQGLINVVWEQGVLIIASAGYQGETPSYPAAYEHVMAVTATDDQDNLAPFTSHGSFVDICAPGVEIRTIWGADDYVEVSGTSFSTAFVSGLAALVRAWAPSYTNDQTENLIITTADPIGDPDMPGRINSYNCIMAVGVDDDIIDKPDRVSVNAYPNPFNARTTISYSLPTASDISIEIFDIIGRKVAFLFEGQQEAGNHNVIWDAKEYPTGIYFARMKTRGLTMTIKMTLLK